jgi:hypothetical protein
LLSFGVSDSLGLSLKELQASKDVLSVQRRWGCIDWVDGADDAQKAWDVMDLII